MVLVFRGYSEWGNGPVAGFILFYIVADVSITYDIFIFSCKK